MQGYWEIMKCCWTESAPEQGAGLTYSVSLMMNGPRADLILKAFTVSQACHAPATSRYC